MKRQGSQITSVVQRHSIEGEEEALLQTQHEAKSVPLPLQQQAEEEDKKKETIQSKDEIGGAPRINSNLASRIQSLRGGGQPLPKSERAYFEPRFAHDFSQIPVHGSAPRNIQLKLKGIAPGNIVSNAPGVHKSAQRGLSGSARPLPYLETIQRSFGQHALTGVKAFVGGPAREANERMGSSAYVTGGSVAFKQSPDLHTAAHEAAHIVQQRTDVQLQGGVGQSGDRYEQNADAVADAVVNGHSTEPLLDRYAWPHSMHSNLVQFSNGVCEDLRPALSNSVRVIELYREFLDGNIEWEEMQSQTRMIGNAAQGVVGAGRELPQIVQDAINEVESFGFEEIGHMERLVWGLPSLVLGSGEFFQSQWVRNEIERQNHFNRVIIRYMYENACPDFPGQWTDFQQQILPIGTRGLEQRSSVETPGTPRETRTALAWVAVGREHVLVLATEVENSGRLRFERWIDSDFRELALRQARSTQGSITTVPSSAVVGLPSSVPSAVARR